MTFDLLSRPGRGPELPPDEGGRRQGGSHLHVALARSDRTRQGRFREGERLRWSTRSLLAVLSQCAAFVPFSVVTC